MGRARGQAAAVSTLGFDALLGARRGTDRDRDEGDVGIVGFYGDEASREEAWKNAGISSVEEIVSFTPTVGAPVTYNRLRLGFPTSDDENTLELKHQPGHRTIDLFACGQEDGVDYPATNFQLNLADFRNIVCGKLLEGSKTIKGLTANEVANHTQGAVWAEQTARGEDVTFTLAHKNGGLGDPSQKITMPEEAFLALVGYLDELQTNAPAP